MRALVFKELREIAGFGALALAAYLALVFSLMGVKVFALLPGLHGRTENVPFVGNEFLPPFLTISAIFLVVLGFRQSFWESVRGTFLFLLHRPISRNALFLVKLATGIGVFLVCACLTIVLYAWWASVPGRHPGPFSWAMTSYAWRLTYLLPLLYLGAFLSGLRPARWYGTRLLPLVTAGALVVTLSLVPWWWPLGFPVSVVLYLVMTSSICHVAHVRDYP